MSTEVAGRLVGIIDGQVAVWSESCPQFAHRMTASDARRLARWLEQYAGEVDSARIRRWVRRGQDPRPSYPAEVHELNPPVTLRSGDTFTVTLGTSVSSLDA